MDRQAYLTKTLPFKAELMTGEVLTGEYLPNYMNGKAMDALESAIGKLTKEGKAVPMRETYDIFIEHLTLVVSDIDLSDGGKKVPFTTDAQKREALKTFSQDDITIILKAVQDAVADPLGKTGTDSSDGQPPLDE